MNTNMCFSLLSAIGAYVIWGVLPLYWKPLSHIDAVTLMAWRLVGFAPLTWLFALCAPGRIKVPARSDIPKLLLASFFILVNWGTFLWAIGNDMVIEISLGYYMNPLVNVILGVLILSESMGKRKLLAVIIATMAVILMTLEEGKFPFVSILLAVCFAFYGLMTKKLAGRMNSIESLAWQSLVFAPLGLFYLIYSGGFVSFATYGFGVMGMISMAGFVTFLPLWLFGMGARGLSLGFLGFLQYIGPSLILLMGVLFFGESFSLLRIVVFSMIFVALIIYSLTLKNI